MASISNFPFVQVSLKGAIKCDVKFQRFFYIKDSVIVSFNI